MDMETRANKAKKAQITRFMVPPVVPLGNVTKNNDQWTQSNCRQPHSAAILEQDFSGRRLMNFSEFDQPPYAKRR